jgi:drug/metabolite transporter (DMT)-like permease
VFVAVLAIPLFGERPAATFRWWSLVSLAGAAFVVLGSSSSVDGDLFGMLLALLSTFAFACFFVVSKMARPEISVLPFLTIALSTAAVWVTVFVFVTGLEPMSVSGADRWRATAMALVPGGLGHIAMTWPLNYLPANVPPLFRLATPAVAGGMAWVFLGEGFTLVHVIDGAVIVAGIAGAVLSQAGRDLVAEARQPSSVAD